MKRTVLVTGASSGIGRTLCEALAGRGDEVVGLARDFSKFPDAATRLVAHYAIDLSDLNSLASHLRVLTTAHPAIDAIICNAGYGRFGHLEQFSFDQISRLMDVNFTSHACLVRACLPLMKAHKRGDIIFMGSDAALRGGQRGAVYCASKFAMRGFAQGSARGMRGCGYSRHDPQPRYGAHILLRRSGFRSRRRSGELHAARGCGSYGVLRPRHAGWHRCG